MFSVYIYIFFRAWTSLFIVYSFLIWYLEMICGLMMNSINKKLVEVNDDFTFYFNVHSVGKINIIILFFISNAYLFLLLLVLCSLVFAQKTPLTTAESALSFTAGCWQWYQEIAGKKTTKACQHITLMAATEKAIITLEEARPGAISTATTAPKPTTTVWIAQTSYWPIFSKFKINSYS